MKFSFSQLFALSLKSPLSRGVGFASMFFGKKGRSMLSLLHSSFSFLYYPPHPEFSGHPSMEGTSFPLFSLRLKLLLFLVLFPLLGLAQQSDTTDSPIDQYLQQAAQNNPELKAQYQEYLAALEQVPQVSTLPDPELSFGYFISPIETRVGPQQARFGLTQMFPWFGTLDARGEAATQMAKARFEAFQEARNNLFFRIHKTWFQLYQINQSIRILQGNIDIIETFESLATQRYETARVSQVDVLRVQIEKEDLKTRLELLKDNHKVAIQQFNELLNHEEAVHISIPDSLSAKPITLSATELEMAIMQQNPKLLKLGFEASSARKSIKVAQKEGRPKFGLGVDYIITEKRNVVIPDNGQDALLARGGIKIPLYRKRYRAKEQQAQLQLRAVEDRKIAAENNLQTQLEQVLRDFYDAERRVRLYKDIQIQRTHQAINILTEQYASSDTDFEELLRLQRKLLDYELARETALVDQNIAVAYIEYLYGKYNINSEEI